MRARPRHASLAAGSLQSAQAVTVTFAHSLVESRYLSCPWIAWMVQGCAIIFGGDQHEAIRIDASSLWRIRRRITRRGPTRADRDTEGYEGYEGRDLSKYSATTTPGRMTGQQADSWPPAGCWLLACWPAAPSRCVTARLKIRGRARGQATRGMPCQASTAKRRLRQLRQMPPSTLPTRLAPLALEPLSRWIHMFATAFLFLCICHTSHHPAPSRHQRSPSRPSFNSF